MGFTGQGDDGGELLIWPEGKTSVGGAPGASSVIDDQQLDGVV